MRDPMEQGGQSAALAQRRAARVGRIGGVVLAGLALSSPALARSTSTAPVTGATDATNGGAARFERARHDKKLLRAFLKELPKGAELHSHLAGIPGPDRLLELAAANPKARYQVRCPKGAYRPDDPLAYAFVVDQEADAATHKTAPAAADATATLVPAGELINPTTDERRRQLDGFRRANVVEEGLEHPLEVFYSATFSRRKPVVDNPEMVPILVADAIQWARANHVAYLELQVDPFHHAPYATAAEKERMISLTAGREQMGALIAAAKKENQAGAPVETRFIVSLNRTNGKLFTLLPIAFEMAGGSDEIGAAIAGVNLVNNEYARDGKLGEEIAGPENLRDFLMTLRRIHPGVRLTIHAGETTRWDWHVRDSVLLGAERIGHATNLSLAQKEDVDLLRHRRVLVEACPTSNHLLLGVPFDKHPFLDDLRAGIPVSLNSDDAGVFATDLTEEFARAVEAQPSLTYGELKQLARDSLEYSFATDEQKRALLAAWEQQVAAFEGGKR